MRKHGAAVVASVFALLAWPALASGGHGGGGGGGYAGGGGGGGHFGGGGSHARGGGHAVPRGGAQGRASRGYGYQHGYGPGHGRGHGHGHGHGGYGRGYGGFGYGWGWDPLFGVGFDWPYYAFDYDGVAPGDYYGPGYLYAPEGGYPAGGAGEGNPGPSADAETDSQRGTLRLAVWPPDATVYIDDRYCGIANAVSNTPLDEGHHRIEIVRPGFAADSREFVVTAGRRTHLAITLERRYSRD